jgi:preprotein translocase subunit SecD
MSRSLLWRGVVIAAVVLLSILAAHPLQEKLKLGLDLRGGIHLVLQVEVDDAARSETAKDMDRLIQELQDAGIQANGSPTSSSTFEVNGVPADRDDKIDEIVGQFLPGWDWNRQGETLSFEMAAANLNEIKNLAVVQALETIRNRIDEFGVAEPVIQRQGLEGTRIVVQLPGVDDPERVKKLIKNTAFLEFRLVEYPLGGGGVPTRAEIDAQHGGVPPDHLEVLTGTVRDRQGAAIGEQYYLVQKRPVITGRDLKSARPGLGEFNQPVVNFYLTHEGGKLFAEATAANVGRGLAIVLDGKVVSAPNIRTRIGDSGIIEGSFTRQEVEDLTYLEERTVGPALGQDSIEAGLKAGLIGLALVIVTMLVVYKGTGINAVVALILDIVILFGALAYFKATLTLPGIAGIVLTIGMAVDANVLVFERIREELRHGRTVKSAIEAGFGKALSSVMDANITTLIAALFLFQFGTGPIRGFAVTLSIGILASLFTAIFVSRWIFDLVLAGRKRVDRLSI